MQKKFINIALQVLMQRSITSLCWQIKLDEINWQSTCFCSHSNPNCNEVLATAVIISATAQWQEWRASRGPSDRIDGN